MAGLIVQLLARAWAAERMAQYIDGPALRAQRAEFREQQTKGGGVIGLVGRKYYLSRPPAEHLWTTPNARSAASCSY